MGVIKFKDPVTGKWVQANGSPFPITVTLNGDQASHTSGQIYAHVQSGGTAVLDYVGFTYVLVGCTADYASFDHSYDDDLRDNILVYDDGSVEQREYNNIKSNALTNALIEKITRPTTAKVGQTIVVKSVDSNGKPTQWEAADLPSGGSGSDIVVAHFETQNSAELICTSHSHAELITHLIYKRRPVIAHIAIENPQGNDVQYITADCWVNNGGYVCVGEHFGDYGWCYSGTGSLWQEF